MKKTKYIYQQTIYKISENELKQKFNIKEKITTIYVNYDNSIDIIIKNK